MLEITEILEILEMGFTKEWFVLKIALKLIEDLYRGHHLLKWHNLCQNRYGFRSTLSFILEQTFRLSDSRSKVALFWL